MTHTHGRMLAQLAAPVVIFAHMGGSSLGVTCIMMMHTTFTVLVHANCPLLQMITCVYWLSTTCFSCYHIKPGTMLLTPAQLEFDQMCWVCKSDHNVTK